MSQRLNEYFASEATEYLEQLEGLLALPEVPDSHALLRLSTGVRGSAKMAGAEKVAGVAERLEQAVRSLRSTRAQWSDELRDVAKQTVADLKILVQAHHWGDEEDRRLANVLGQWDRLENTGAGASPQAVSVSALFYEGSGPHLVGKGDREVTAAVVEEPPVVSVGTLLFRGESAIRHALSLRPEIGRALSDGDNGGQPLSAILDELFDLLELGLTGDPLESR
ncbi:MAG: hypothetical protein GEU90_07340 [Gemmatimonas sp.]|nr:hypothetical protein [Gemmatimonas sp.]